MSKKTSLLQQKIRQFLVHSFLYYQLDESIISDQKYDRICLELHNLLEENQNPNIPFLKRVEDVLGKEASGFLIKSYPASITSAAIHLLYQTRYAKSASFEEFIERLGFQYEESRC